MHKVKIFRAVMSNAWRPTKLKSLLMKEIQLNRRDRRVILVQQKWGAYSLQLFQNAALTNPKLNANILI